MDPNLQPRATSCYVSGRPFAEGERVASLLVRGIALEIVRYDLLEEHAAGFAPAGFVACRWVRAYKLRTPGDADAARALKMNAENLFLTLADPANELNAESTRLVQFLALMLERKKLLRPKGRSAETGKNIFEHAKTKQLFEVPAGELTPEFFMQVQQQLSVLVGEPRAKTGAVAEPVATA